MDCSIVSGMAFTCKFQYNIIFKESNKHRPIHLANIIEDFQPSFAFNGKSINAEHFWTLKRFSADKVLLIFSIKLQIILRIVFSVWWKSCISLPHLLKLLIAFNFWFFSSFYLLVSIMAFVIWFVFSAKLSSFFVALRSLFMYLWGFSK